MAFIGQFPALASAVFNLDFLPEYFLVGDTQSNNQSLTNFSVVTSGQQLFSITDIARLTALAKYDSGTVLDAYASPSTVNSEAASWIKLATGRINKATTITGTSNNAFNRDVFASSTNISNVARRGVEQSINPNANATFNDFEALFFDMTNVLRAQIVFSNGYSEEFAPNEIDALYAKYHVAEASGKLAGLSCIDADSGAGLISQVTLYTGSTAAVVVLKTDYVQL